MSSIVITDADGNEVHRLDTTGRTEREIDKIESGLARQMNTDAYYFHREEP